MRPQAADARPYVIRMYDRWIILAIILVLAWFARPFYAFALYYRGVSFERMLVMMTAEHYYKKSIFVYDRIPEGWQGLGELYYMGAPDNRALYEKARSTFERGFALNPHSYWLAFDLGRTYFLGKEYGRAVITFEKAVQLSPTSRAALDYAAWSAFREGNRTLALQYWRRLLSMYPNDPARDIVQRYYGG